MHLATKLAKCIFFAWCFCSELLGY